MLYKQLLLYWVICKLLWSHEKPHVGSHGLGGEAEKSCRSCQSVMGSVTPVCSPAWGGWLPRGQVSSMGTSAGWGGLQQHPHGCSAVGGGSTDSRWGRDLVRFSRSLENGADGCCGAQWLGELGMQGTKSWGRGHSRQEGRTPLRLWGWDCPSDLFAV